MPAMGAWHGPKPKAVLFPPPGKRINGQLKSILNRLFPLWSGVFQFKKWWSFQVCIDLFSCMFPSLSCNKRLNPPTEGKGKKSKGRTEVTGTNILTLEAAPWACFPGGNGPLMGRLYSTHLSPVCPRQKGRKLRSFCFRDYSVLLTAYLSNNTYLLIHVRARVAHTGCPPCVHASIYMSLNPHHSP